MKKYGIYIIIAICVVIVAIACGVGLNKNGQTNTSLTSSNIVEETKKNETQNTIIDETNTIAEEEIQDEISDDEEDINANTTGSSIYEESNDVGSTDKKQEAIDLVKQKWGEDDTVTFRCDSVASNGEYIIAVTSKTSAKVLNYFKVNLENKTVIVDY